MIYLKSILVSFLDSVIVGLNIFTHFRRVPTTSSVLFWFQHITKVTVDYPRDTALIFIKTFTQSPLSQRSGD